MTVSTTSNKIIYSGNGATSVFSFTFPGVAAGDIQVYYTDTDGVQTLLSPSVYTLALTAAVPPNPTGAGGSVTYLPSGSPIGVGTFLTIYRNLSETQETSLSNQGTLLQQVIESSLDYITMITQQLQDLYGRGIVVAVSDPDPLPLPPVAQRANLTAIFDSDGNMTAGAASADANVSAAMIPVVDAATLALARTAMGLGDMAVENIGAGLQDNGSGAARVNFIPHADSTNQAVIAGFHLTERHASGALIYTCPKISTLFAGFGFWVYALDSLVTFAIDAADSFSGMSTGTSMIIQPGSRVYISADGTSTWFMRGQELIGLNSPLNLRINATVATNALTIAIKDTNGNDPSTNSPILIPYRDPTITGGDLVIRALSSALSIVVPASATLGTVNGVPFRLWVVSFDNAGSNVLGVILSVVGGATPTQIFPLQESTPSSGVAISSGSTSAAVFYTASTITSKSFRVLGYIDFNTGQATAGTWATAPSKIQLFGTGIKKPGDVIQSVLNSTTTAASTTSATLASLTNTQTLAITMFSPANILRLLSLGTVSLSQNAGGQIQLQRGSTLIGNPTTISTAAGGASSESLALLAYDSPGDTSAHTYSYQGKTSAGSISYPPASSGVILEIQELMT